MGKDSILLIDGSSMLATNYYGNMPKEILFEKDREKQKDMYDLILKDSKGRYTNGIYGMLKQMFKIIKEQKPTHIAIAFDKTRNTFRRELYADYKGNRSETPAPLKEQFINIEKILTDMGFVVLFDDRYEADDLVGSLVSKIEDEKQDNDYSIYIVTKDRDYLQLVDDKTTLWLMQVDQEHANNLLEKHFQLSENGLTVEDMHIPEKAFVVNPYICEEEYGVKPSQIPDLKGIQGDTSDNIPGVKGVSSAAVPLLQEYGTLEDIYDAIHSVGDDKTEERTLLGFWKTGLGIKRSPLNGLRTYEKEAILSKELATIKRDCEIDATLDDMVCNVDNDVVNNILQDYDINSLVDSFK